MYWTLETRRPTLDEIMVQGEDRIRKSIDDACAGFETPQIPVKLAPSWMDEKSVTARRHLQKIADIQNAFVNQSCHCHAIPRGASIPSSGRVIWPQYAQGLADVYGGTLG
jgi:hypothetical protein